MIIRATQKKIISKPVTKVVVGWKELSFGVFEGHPSVAKVHRLEENHVSRTSSS